MGKKSRSGNNSSFPFPFPFQGPGDARQWDEAAYRRSLLSERRLAHRTIFRAAFAPSPLSLSSERHSLNLNLNPDDHLLQSPSSSPSPSLPDTLVTASSDGSVAAYSSSSSSSPLHFHQFAIIQAHQGPVYDLQFSGDHSHSLLFSAGDDGHIRAWKWTNVLNCKQGHHINPILDIVNPQQEDPWGARSPIPETNAIAVHQQEGCIFSAAGDGCAYAWDLDTGKCKTVFRGHQDYLHSVAVCKLSNQIVTGSEDGTSRIWDCRSGKCTNVISPNKKYKSGESSWVSSVAVDPSESWLACGSFGGLSVWSLVSNECIFNIERPSPIQDVVFDNNQILSVGGEPVLSRHSINGSLISQVKCAPSSPFSVSLHPSGVVAVAGYGGLVDVISEYGSHLCTFSCIGFDDVA
ncbi:THO complex subunit 6 [Rhynchospora pubera]|uniref:THO complex subunit 6 n=1 Tax=Rhynchospora pubera TaxID=906938 RepID=A0AAV8CSZ3_9POAL|nr:THO complex subunit 6 [Rhynchospora pubera]